MPKILLKLAVVIAAIVAVHHFYFSATARHKQAAQKTFDDLAVATEAHQPATVRDILNRLIDAKAQITVETSFARAARQTDRVEAPFVFDKTGFLTYVDTLFTVFASTRFTPELQDLVIAEDGSISLQLTAEVTGTPAQSDMQIPMASLVDCAARLGGSGEGGKAVIDRMSCKVRVQRGPSDSAPRE